MENMWCTSSTITVISQSNTLDNIELNDLSTLDSPCSTPKSHSTDISTSSNINATDELIEKVKEMNEHIYQNLSLSFKLKIVIG